MSFRPAWWSRNAHVQTIGGRYLRSATGVDFRRLRLDTPDGDFVDVDIAEPADRIPLRRDGLVVVMHGLEGSARSRYAMGIYRELHRVGMPCAGLNFRSCSGELNRRLRFYHSGDTADLEHALAELGRLFPRRWLAAVGVSLGGNVLLKHLGDRGDTSPVSAAAVWSVPFDLAAGARFMESGLGPVYSRALLASLQRKVRAKGADLARVVNVGAALRARTFFEFDDALTAPLHGFAGADDYYRRSSCAPRISGVRVPTLVLHARDDPFVPSQAVPEAAMARNAALEEAVSDRGGHVGFLAGPSPLRPRPWAEAATAAWLAEKLRP